ncbi:hypothetical protein HanHA89_Chr01g0018671 [Helianthus annuus]|nr:hypothetical protein HanHA89_Chr01g0018671 [Helianthus annuus]
MIASIFTLLVGGTLLLFPIFSILCHQVQVKTTGYHLDVII